MKILEKTKETVSRETSVIDMEDGSTVVVIDIIKGRKVLDTIYRDAATGIEIDNADLIEKIEAFLGESS